MFGLGLGEIVVIGIVGVLLFGGKLPDIARAAGKGVREFQKGFRDIKDNISKDDPNDGHA